MNPAVNYILNQEEPYKGILLFLQSFIEKTYPEAVLKYKYKIPFYYIEERPFCYLNQTKGYVDLGFWMGARISKNQSHLVRDGRKVIQSLRYKSLDEINTAVLESVLEEAHSLKDKKFYK